MLDLLQCNLNSVRAMIIVCFLLLLKKKASKNGFINIQAFKIVIGSIMLIILSENLFLWLSFQNYWHKIIQNILVPVVKPPFSPSFVSMHFVTFLKCTFSILNFLWYILMIFSHLLSYQRNDRIPLLAASFWCCVSIWLRLVKRGEVRETISMIQVEWLEQRSQL